MDVFTNGSVIHVGLVQSQYQILQLSGGTYYINDWLSISQLKKAISGDKNAERQYAN